MAKSKAVLMIVGDYVEDYEVGMLALNPRVSAMQCGCGFGGIWAKVGIWIGEVGGVYSCGSQCC